MWRAFPIKEIPKNISEDKIFYGECIFRHEGYALVRPESYPEDPDLEYDYFEKFYIWEKVTSGIGLDAREFPSYSFRGYGVDFEIDNNYKNIEFPDIFHNWFLKYIFNNKIRFQVESENNEVIYIEFQINKERMYENEYE